MTKPRSLRILAIDPGPKGFGFAVFENSECLLDWGVKTAKGEDKNGKCQERVKELCDRYHPDVLVIEDCEVKGCRRHPCIRYLLRLISSQAKEAHVRVRAMSRAKVRATFAPRTKSSTKHQIAVAIAGKCPELGHLVPPARRPWMSESWNMALFNAIALALTYLCFDRSRRVFRRL